MMAKVLLLEDDPNLGFILNEHLKMNGFEVVHCKDGEEGTLAFNEGAFDICLVDIMMPKKDGFTFVAELRKKDQNVPVIFLTAKSLSEDRIEGFKLGCDDYITKPFSMEELLLRIRAVLRRTAGASAPVTDKTVFSIGGYLFDPVKQRLSFNGTSAELTTKESQLLKLLCQYKATGLERETALKEIWGDDSYFNARSMDVFIVRLRKLLKADPGIAIINIHGKGYKLIDPGSS